MQNVSFDLRCNELEEWLTKRNYNLTVVRKQVLKARAYSRDTLLDKVKEVRNNDRFVLTLTHHPSIKNFQNVLNEAHILLTLNKEHRKVFENKPPMIGWRKPKSLKDHLVLKLNVNHLQIIKVRLVGLDVKFSLLLRKPKIFKARTKVKHLTLEKGF